MRDVRKTARRFPTRRNLPNCPKRSLFLTAAHPEFTSRFQDDLSTPGLRIPLTADARTFREGAALGRTVVWLHTFGERMTDPKAGRPAGPPRLPAAGRPNIPVKGAIPADADTIEYDAKGERLCVGSGYVERVSQRVWNYQVSGKQVLPHWFSYRRKTRARPLIGDRRPPSPLGEIQPSGWTAEYTTELLNVLNVLGWLIDLEPDQARLLERVCAGPLISEAELRAAGVFERATVNPKRRASTGGAPGLFGPEVDEQ